MSSLAHFSTQQEHPFLDDFDADDAIEWEDAMDAAEYRDGFITIGDLEDWEAGEGYEDEWDEDDSWLGDYDRYEGVDDYE